MSREIHKQFLEKAALREAQKAFAGRDRAGTRLEDFLSLRVQTVEPWKRVVAVLVGFGFFGMAIWSQSEEFGVWAVITFGAIGALCASVAIMGWKRPVEAVLNVTADVLFQRLLDLI